MPSPGALQEVQKGSARLSIKQACIQKINSTTDSEDTEAWIAQEKKAQQKRLHKEDTMDIYEVSIAKLPSKSEIQLHLSQQETRNRVAQGTTGVLLVGLKLEETQIQLQMYGKQIKQKGTTTKKLELEERCQHLISRVDAFDLKVEIYLGNINVANSLEEVSGWPNSDKDDIAENINLFDLPGSFDGNDGPTKRRNLVLPSNLEKALAKLKAYTI
ncbi:hypothetical protein SERLA73DRAFT_70102 [Serpula lacrymans var. lacrymans S7.3]|uniref:Uncharacterized protein n=1 Tax=Serpula lacrymans var. lacrymans (strain S7.3) TaxID=936435 RepID=F8PLW7_SERL3|nr:hypothetical protein SERLA73DRAFT_70102 [Serpula lacrymans var. lacrymans S7.3]